MIRFGQHGAILGTFAGVGLSGVAVLHAIWATGCSWPAKDARELAQHVTGSYSMPSSEASAIVAVGSSVGALIMYGAGGQQSWAIKMRRTIGAGFMARGICGGVLATKALKLPGPGPRFRELDTKFYRPLCLMLGTAALGATRK
ncbi:hypothetical protein CQ018_01100 [Arthrobacter sp. MYb227]|uniref:DUF3995 domain-containing protein n=1 Tax=Arthrobacter sp. MYb227 TaxID=1848601 RepID=UPI000CFCF0A2|nr:DUF3995 domain-containing protein [Arthrobacter sp. MYb227]PQZ95925.1 hypothetical protein CQ018_01100 [Arthrobacter sp. MYb227]